MSLRVASVYLLLSGPPFQFAFQNHPHYTIQRAGEQIIKQQRSFFSNNDEINPTYLKTMSSREPFLARTTATVPRGPNRL